MMKIVAADESHFADIACLVSTPEELYLVYPRGRFPWSGEQVKALAVSRREPTVVLVDGQVVAFANLCNVDPGAVAFIGNVIVADPFKGRGIGQALIRHMIELCQNRYSAVAHLAVFGFNARALLLYARLGFKPYAVEARQNLSGEPVALIKMHYVES
ncbi:GNAT family N-acetyltransferase [Halioxenophilus sp. WMMB6]|uniref:GNAT family N-acetyltransferase n=1 Tax=Halioxenophilus sp. WMMB6 TaxID=3073815 RepID=UPI00295EF681|nr:GNAT family N-acetyltransferase [Halioxenophilus sp. WMMB6]